MNFDDLEELIRRYLSTGFAVVIILVSPGTDTGTGDSALPADPSITVIEPDGSQVTEPGRPPTTEPYPPPTTETDQRPTEPYPPPTTETDRPPATEPYPPPTTEPDRPPTTEPYPPPTTETDRPPATEPYPPPTTEPDRPPTTEPYPPPTTEPYPPPTGEPPPDRKAPVEPPPPTRSTSPPDSSAAPGGPGDGNAGTDTGSAKPNDPGPNREAPAADSTGKADGRVGADGSDPGREGDQTTIDASTSPDAGTGKDTSAADRYGWGKPNRVDDFSGGAEQWNVYDGPGHAGQGTRSPSAVSIQDGILTITGDPSGTTAGMAWNSGQKYGRWEARVRVPAVDSSYSPVLLLWPDAENFPAGGEIDFMEMLNPIGLTANIFIHYGADNLQVNGQVEIDTTEWHNWALEWTPEAITAYVDGEEWYRTTDTSVFPTGPMHLAIQLDWFPQGGASQGSAIQADWVKQYSLDGSVNSEDGKRFRADPSTENGSAVAGTAGAGSDADTRGVPATPVRDALWRMFFWWW